MKGIVLAGGLGTRMHPLTKVTNKHLLPVYNRPMIYYPIQTLVDAGISEILVVTGGNNAGDFLRLLGNGKEFGLKHLDYTYQEGHGGIAAALILAEYFADPATKLTPYQTVDADHGREGRGGRGGAGGAGADHGPAGLRGSRRLAVR